MEPRGVLGLWWCGVALTGPVVAVFHTAALHDGTLIEVEAVMVSSLLFALAFGALLTHQSVSRRDWWSAVMVVIGLALFLGSADPHGDDHGHGAAAAGAMYYWNLY